MTRWAWWGWSSGCRRWPPGSPPPPPSAAASRPMRASCESSPTLYMFQCFSLDTTSGWIFKCYAWLLGKPSHFTDNNELSMIIAYHSMFAFPDFLIKSLMPLTLYLFIYKYWRWSDIFMKSTHTWNDCVLYMLCTLNILIALKQEKENCTTSKFFLVCFCRYYYVLLKGMHNVWHKNFMYNIIKATYDPYQRHV